MSPLKGHLWLYADILQDGVPCAISKVEICAVDPMHM